MMFFEYSGDLFIDSVGFWLLIIGVFIKDSNVHVKNVSWPSQSELCLSCIHNRLKKEVIISKGYYLDGYLRKEYAIWAQAVTTTLPVLTGISW